MARPKGIYINENLTPYRKEMMSLAVEKRHDGKINKVWTLDCKIFIKTTPTGIPRQLFSVEDIIMFTRKVSSYYFILLCVVRVEHKENIISLKQSNIQNHRRT